MRCDCLLRFLILYMVVRNDKEVKEELRSVWWLLDGIGDRISSADPSSCGAVRVLIKERRESYIMLWMI